MQCPICTESYTAETTRTPKVLVCGHTVCAHCLDRSGGAGNGQIQCPICRAKMPAEQVTVNFALRDVLPSVGGAAAQANAPPAETGTPAQNLVELPTQDETTVSVGIAALPPDPLLLPVTVGEANVAVASHPDVLDVMVSVEPPQGSARAPVDICCIVDVSDSMATEALAQDGTGCTVSHGLAILDIVRHALKTIIRILGASDRLCIVSYANSAKVVLDLTAMTDSGRRDAEFRLQNLQVDGMTNLWAGLNTGLELLEKGSEPGRLQHIMLLTDGVPNLNPPRGIVPMLKRFKDKAPGKTLPCTLNTFGFGYELDSELLSEIATIGCGSYAFIPDAGFVGTVFVNAMTNLLVTMAKNLTLTFEPSNDVSLVSISKTIGPVLGGLPSSAVPGGGLKVDMGTLQFGQRRHVLVRMNVPAAAREGEWLRVTLQYQTRALNDAAPLVKTASGVPGADDDMQVQELQVQRVRVSLVDCVRQAQRTAKQTNLDKLQKKPSPLPQAQAMVQALDAAITSLPVAQSEQVGAIIEDIQGQVAEAFSREEFYTKWGIHFVPSLTCAHLHQQCNNFKDPGVQQYGGDLFADQRDKADEVYLNLPAPVASVRRSQPRAPDPVPPRPSHTSMNAAISSAPISRPPQPQVSMAAYHDRYAGCIDGSCMARMADGSFRRVCEIRKGDFVVSRGGEGGDTTAREVQCVVRTVAPEGRFPLVQLPNGPRLTPYHPVYIAGEWRFPIDVQGASRPEDMLCHAVFTFVLRGGGSLVVDEVCCASLGHGIDLGAASHPYFASPEKVLSDLGRLPGFDTGQVDLEQGSVRRDPLTGCVCGIGLPNEG